MSSNKTCYKIVAQNKKVSFNYDIESNLEAGIVLTGSEVKSARNGKISIADAYADVIGKEIYLYNCHVAEYSNNGFVNHEPNRLKKLLIKKKDINKLIGKISMKGYTLVVRSVYFNSKNILKVDLCVASGKKKYDKRAAIREKDLKREQQRMFE